MSGDGYRLIFMGTPDFAVPSLQALIASRHQVVAVVTQPDTKKGRGKKLAAPPVKTVAEKAGIEVLQPTTIKTAECTESLAAFRPDLIVVAAYGRILPGSILDLPPLGCINVHGSLLPRHRGAAPIQWSVIEGDRRTGVTIMQMDTGMDTGDILLAAAIDVEEGDTAGSLFTTLARLGATALLDALEKLERKELTPTPQDHRQATKAPPLDKEMGRIDWSKSAEKIHCLIRGLDPWPSAYTFLGGKRVKLFSPQILNKASEAIPGTVIRADRQGIIVACGSAALRIKEMQPEGKKRMSAEAFLCGHSLATGSLFGDN